MPADAADDRLRSHVHPPDWINPEPRGRYHLAVVGGGTAGLVSAMGAAGLGAVANTDGKTGWVFTAPRASLGAAPTAVPGVVFEGTGDGRLFAVSAGDGKQLWEFNTVQPFETVNKVAARGGQIAVSGAVIVDGMVYIGTGYAISAGASGGNVLLAFGVE